MPAASPELGRCARIAVTLAFSNGAWGPSRKLAETLRRARTKLGSWRRRRRRSRQSLHIRLNEFSAKVDSLVAHKPLLQPTPHLGSIAGVFSRSPFNRDAIRVLSLPSARSMCSRWFVREGLWAVGWSRAPVRFLAAINVPKSGFMAHIRRADRPGVRTDGTEPAVPVDLFRQPGLSAFWTRHQDLRS
jgi:hypothetical protein